MPIADPPRASTTAECTAPRATGAAWVLTDGSVGMENQGLAVAEALGMQVSRKRVRRKGLLPHLPTWLQTKLPARALLKAASPQSGDLAPPWPRLLISVGRRSVPLALAIKRLARGGTFALHIQDPKINPVRFDLVAAPLHDGLSGANVVTTFGAAHRVTPARLSKAAQALASKLSHLQHPFITVLIGGASRAYRFDALDAERFGNDIARLARQANGSLLVTPSRRTGAANMAIIARCLEGVPAEIWQGEGENPYFAFLGLADAIVVTSDSVNMVTEAAGTGKPVYVYPLRGYSSRLARFHAAMRQRGATRTFDGRLDRWSYEPVNDTEVIAAAVRGALAADKGAEVARSTRSERAF